MQNQAPFFRFEKLKPWNWVMMVCYVVLSYKVWCEFEESQENKTKIDLLLCYTIGTHVFVYFFQYRAMRNLYVYLFWVLIGLIHLYFYGQLIDDRGLMNEHGLHATTGLRNTIILLLLFQVLRFVSLKVQGVEIVCPDRHGLEDLLDNRRSTTTDLILTLIYMICMMVLLFVPYN